jgi:hypothetical protein
MPGINVDVLNQPPTVALLQQAGIDAVRLVSQPDPNGPGVHPLIEQYLADLKAANIFALVVITGQSAGKLPANNQGWFQCRNEPDGQPPASEPMTTDQYVQEFNTYSETFPQFNWVAAGLCGSDPLGYWQTIAPQLVNCTGFAVHPYLKTPTDATALVDAMQAVDTSKLAFVTEFNTDAGSLLAMLVGLHGDTAGQYWYAAGDWMNSGYGLLDHPDKLTAWTQALQLIQNPPQPQPEQWVDLSNYQGDLTANMMADMRNSGVVGIVSQAITGLNGMSYCRQQLQAALEGSFRIAGYAWCFHGVSVSQRLHMFDGFQLEYLALDNEQAGITIADVNRDFGLCDQYMGKLTEDYTARWFFQQQGWQNFTGWSGRPLWYALYDNEKDLADFAPFGGWTRPRMHQFSASQVFGGVKCDISIRYPTMP